MSSLNKQLLKAAWDGKLVDVKRLVQDEGADVNFISLYGYGYTALYCASTKGFTEMARFLVDNGANVNFKRVDESTALHVASMKGHEKVVRFLVENGADVDCKDKYGYTALHYANSYGQIEAAFILLRKESELSVKNIRGKSPLDDAHYTNAATALSRRAKLNQDPDMATLMHEMKLGMNSLVEQHKIDTADQLMRSREDCFAIFFIFLFVFFASHKVSRVRAVIQFKLNKKKLKSELMVRDYSVSNDTCPICLESLADGNTCHAHFPCGHKLHLGCSTRLPLCNVIVCPLCRGIYSTVPSNNNCVR
jgi:hypothetical protein